MAMFLATVILQIQSSITKSENTASPRFPRKLCLHWNKQLWGKFGLLGTCCKRGNNGLIFDSLPFLYPVLDLNITKLVKDQRDTVLFL